MPGRWWTRRARRWPGAGSTTSSAAGSRGTPWTGSGWSRTSRRCSTTTPSCWASTPGGADPLGERVAAETADFLVRELGTAEGGFAAALDADSEGEEGRFYVWTPAQLREALGEQDGAWAAALLEVTTVGTFEHGASTLQLLRDPADPSDEGRWADVRGRLLAVRGRAGPAGPRRQGGGGVERAGDRLPGRRGPAARPRGPRGGGAAGGHAAGRPAPPTGRVAAPGLPRRRRGAAPRRAGGPRLRGPRLPRPGGRHG